MTHTNPAPQPPMPGGELPGTLQGALPGEQAPAAATGQSAHTNASTYANAKPTPPAITSEQLDALRATEGYLASRGDHGDVLAWSLRQMLVERFQLRHRA